MTELQFTTVDRVLAKFHRDLRGTSINESDAIEWIGEALGHLNVPQMQEEVVAFLEVKNYETDVPAFFNMVIQIAKKRNWTKQDPCVTPEVIDKERCGCKCKERKDECNCRSTSTTKCTCGNYNDCLNPCGECVCQDKTAVYTDCQGNIIGPYERAYYRPYFDLQWEYSLWTDSSLYHREFIPVRLSNHTFFNSLVCRENDRGLYRGDVPPYEYTIVGTVSKKLRFNFKEGLVALSYLRSVIDAETGYPLIPDNESYMAAITYYIKWKIAEWYQWNGREGFNAVQGLTADLERKWLKYAKQAKNYMKMPKGLDMHQNLMEQTYSLPSLYRYNNFFGNSNHIFRK